MFMKQLEASNLADHRYHLEGEEERSLCRAVCTSGTRERILANITTWAKDSSLESQTIYWLFGLAGTGKSTIAFTLARRFELAGNTDTTALGGNFFCSRQFEETKQAKRIVRTIVYHLALVCKPFANALARCGRFDTIHRDVRTQLEDLLVRPWRESESDRLADPSTPLHYLIVIDALDEIDGKGGSDFLRDLLHIINKRHLRGLKFFATSRPDPDLVNYIRSFEDKQLYRLEEVPSEEVQDDIAKYLNASLPHFVGSPTMDRLVSQADGLFIYAATVVKYLADLEEVEQKQLLDQLLATSALGIPQTEEDEAPLLDQLYLQLLSNAFDHVPSASDRSDSTFFTRSSAPRSAPQHPSSPILFPHRIPIRSLRSLILFSHSFMLCSIPNTTRFSGTINLSLTFCLIRIGQRSSGATKRSIIGASWNPASGS